MATHCTSQNVPLQVVLQTSLRDTEVQLDKRFQRTERIPQFVILSLKRIWSLTMTRVKMLDNALCVTESDDLQESFRNVVLFSKVFIVRSATAAGGKI